MGGRRLSQHHKLPAVIRGRRRCTRMNRLHRVHRVHRVHRIHRLHRLHRLHDLRRLRRLLYRLPCLRCPLRRFWWRREHRGAAGTNELLIRLQDRRRLGLRELGCAVVIKEAITLELNVGDLGVDGRGEATWHLHANAAHSEGLSFGHAGSRCARCGDGVGTRPRGEPDRVLWGTRPRAVGNQTASAHLLSNHRLGHVDVRVGHKL